MEALSSLKPVLDAGVVQTLRRPKKLYLEGLYPLNARTRTQQEHTHAPHVRETVRRRKADTNGEDTDIIHSLVHLASSLAPRTHVMNYQEIFRIIAVCGVTAAFLIDPTIPTRRLIV